jgi:hypothetical protein
MTPEIRAQVIESRRRQGLPDTIQDPVFLSRLAEILLADPVDLPTPDSDGEVPPQPMPGEPDDPGRW